MTALCSPARAALAPAAGALPLHNTEQDPVSSVSTVLTLFIVLYRLTQDETTLAVCRQF